MPANTPPNRTSSLNTSGIIGVSRYRHFTKKNGKSTYMWQAFYRENGKDQLTKFTIGKYGEEGAFHKACRLRYNKSGKLYVTDISLVPFKIRPPHEYV